ncbi:MAG: HAMP domain-containing histidine kinase [Bacilli bacterium]|nr:HAMP domain-containing histidine kinase [Bacilli bacterium]
MTTILTLTGLFVRREQNINDAHNINTLRAYTSSIVNMLNEEFPSIDQENITMRLDALELKCLVSDLSSNIIFNNTSFSTSDIGHDLYQDQTYSLTHEDWIKVSFPISNDTEIVGIVIFEVPTKVLTTNQDGFFLIMIVVEVGLMLITLGYLLINYQKTYLKPLHQLNLALLDVSNGIYRTIETEEPFSISSFTYYNIMLEKLENTLHTQADYAKSRKQLIANISHEIRTPLSYVKLSAELLSKESDMSDENKKYVDTILNKITEINNIIEDLFRYSKQDLDQLVIELKETYAKDMFDRIFENITFTTKEKNIIIECHNQIENILINADENRLVQVVSNMVDNAKKHIPQEGYIHLKTEIDENHLVLIIEDSGEGIEPQDLPYIFEPFYQGSQDQKTKKKGAGLGLAICDYIIGKHDGEIFVYSEKGKGTKFVIKFPEMI